MARSAACLFASLLSLTAALLLGGCGRLRTEGIRAALATGTMVTIENQRNVPVRVSDGTFALGTLQSGETRTFLLLGRGTRSLVVRWSGGEARTAPWRFEDNRGWRLTIALDGSLTLDLHPIGRR